MTEHPTTITTFDRWLRWTLLVLNLMIAIALVVVAVAATGAADESRTNRRVLCSIVVAWNQSLGHTHVTADECP